MSDAPRPRDFTRPLEGRAIAGVAAGLADTFGLPANVVRCGFVVLGVASGFGVILYGAAIKLFVLSAVVLHVVVPFQTHVAATDWLLFVLEMLGVAVAIGVVESVMARLQMRHVPTLLVAASLLCGFGFLLMLR